MTHIPAFSNETVLEDGDYVVPDGEGIWLTVRNLSVRIRDIGDCLSICTYPLGDEMRDAIDEYCIDYRILEDA